jgi:alcohol dehydrogenase
LQSNGIGFDFALRTRLVFGGHSLDQLGGLAVGLGLKKVLLVTDLGIIKAGHVARAEQSLRQAGLNVSVYDRVHENPTTRDVAACVAVAKEAGIDGLVGLGGGSSLDTAKGCNFLLTNGGQMKDYWGVGKASKPMLPFIAIPTTAGTGSECQCAALITDEVTHQKMACLDPKVAAKIAILDPVLTMSQPKRVTACTGLDAIAHAVETAVTTKRNPISKLFSREAFRLCAGILPQVLKHPHDLESRGRMLLGAAYAGLAIENSMLGAAHAAANPLTARHGLVHGHAVGLMLPEVVRFNLEIPALREIYDDLCDAARLGDAPKLPEVLEHYLATTGLPQRLADCGIERAQIPALADEAARQWTAQFNPRAITAKEFEGLYEAVLD